MFRRILPSFIFCLLLLFLVVGARRTARAQATTTGNLSGTVTDTSPTFTNGGAVLAPTIPTNA